MFNNGGYGQQQQQPQYGNQYGVGGLAPQPTGYQQPNQYSQPLAAQPTGYQQQSFQQFQQPVTSFQQPLYSQQTGYVQPQQTGFVGGNQFNQQPQVQAPLAAEPTGFFTASQKVEKNTDLKIPNIRLSFISYQDQAKFEELFRSAVSKGSNSLSADAARDILMRSNLQPIQLAKIWELSDLNKSGQLLFPEFALALHLVNIALTGKPIPQVLEPSIKGEVTGFVDAINFSIPDEVEKTKTPFDNLTQTNSLNQLSGLQFQQPAPTSFGVQPQMTGYQPMQPQRTGFQAMQPQSTGFQQIQPQATGFQPMQLQRTGFNSLQAQQTGNVPINTFNSFQPPQLLPQSTGYQGLQPQQTGSFNAPQLLQAQKTGVGNNTFFQSNLLAPQKTGGFQNMNQFQNYNNSQDFIKPQEKQLFSKIFETYDSKKQGKLDGKVCSEIFRKSGLNRSELEKVWNLVTPNNEAALSRESFSLGMWLIYRKLNGHELPNRLPESLLPSSTQILNGVKDQLKAQTSSFGNSFKNNDNDINYSKKIEKEASDVDLLKAQLEHKQSLLDSLTQESQALASSSTSSANDLKSIEDLKNQIKSIPFGNNSEKLQLKDKLNSLTSRVPELIHEISRTNNEITNAQIELYKIKNPSSIIGSGPNGEVTDADKRKAKNKALLNQRMAALTGKPVAEVVDYDDQQKLFETEVSKIRQSNKDNQEIILDIERTIKDLAKGAEASLTGSIDSNNYKKFELGIGVDSEVADLIKDLRISSSTTSASRPVVSAVRSAPVVPQKTQAVQEVSKASTPDSYSSHKTPEQRAAYIKEQAKKRMNERLAKFGISRGKSESTESVPTVATPAAPAPAPVPASAPSSISPTPVVTPAAASQSHPASRAPAVVKAPESVVSSLSNKKKLEKEARLAELRRQLEEAEQEDDDDEAEVAPKPTQTYAPAKSTAPPPPPPPQPRQSFVAPPAQLAAAAPAQVVQPVAPAPVPIAAPIAPTPAPQESNVEIHHESNPFAKNLAISSNNPFGKHQSGPTPVAAAPPSADLKQQIEAQRKAQRGFDEDDGWSDEEKQVDDDDDDIPNRQGAAHLAGLLFSGMGPSRTNSQVSTPKEEIPQPKSGAQAKPVPIAPPVPSLSSSSVPTISSIASPAPVSEAAAPAVPIAAPLPEVAPPAPAVPIAAPLPSIVTPPIPVAPALPTIAAPPTVSTPVLTEDNEEFYTPEPQSEPDYVATTAQEESRDLPPPLPQFTAPTLPEALVPSVPQFEAPPLPEVDAPAPPPLPEISAPPAQSLPGFSAPTLPDFAAPPLPEVSVPATPALPEFAAPSIPQFEAPPLPQTSIPAAPSLPETSAPSIPQFSAPPPPPLPAMSAPPAAPPAPPLAPPPPALVASSAPAPSIGGGLPFLAEIQRRRDDSHTVG